MYNMLSAAVKKGTLTRYRPENLRKINAAAYPFPVRRHQNKIPAAADIKIMTGFRSPPETVFTGTFHVTKLPFAVKILLLLNIFC